MAHILDVPDALGVPDALPVLSRGKHRRPRHGGCFMEIASFLAGERWSDHPACTHPLLAALARHVNDVTGDDARPRLAPLIPSVIGVVGDDPRLDVELARLAAVRALPVTSEERQHVLALALLATEAVDRLLDGGPPDDEIRSPEVRAVLRLAPGAEAWARDFRRRVGGRVPVSVRTFRRFTAPNTVRHAVEGIATSCTQDPERMLYDLLVDAIAVSREVLGRGTVQAPSAEQWDAACRLVGTAPGPRG
ncbi:hypothetical protein ACFP6A_09990 [Quadrisphaera sp. GCM10027208]|uniref:hypothetical protein n=1 Tax=Quadrisphaera sp. GCM10027208 TaxID=3273423 RepID=UPI003619AC09